MDPRTIDRLARVIGSGQSRRRVLKLLASGAVGSLAAAVGLSGESAASRTRSVGNICARNADCTSNLCIAAGRGRHICGCVTRAECPQATDQCHSAACSAGVCSIGVNVSASCTDGYACTTGETCQANGSCGGGTATVCTARDQCHIPGTCDPGTGLCANPTKTDATTCDDGNASTCNDVCTGGTCAGTTVNLNTDNANCGGGGLPCLAGETCTDGVCKAPISCSSAPNGTACGTGGACLDGVCFLAEPNCYGCGRGNYGVALNSNGANACTSQNSGTCNQSCTTASDCPTGQWCILTCQSGHCVVGCPA